MGTKIETVTPMDAWLLARCCVGYTASPSHLKQASPIVQHLVEFLGQINLKDRDATIQMNLSPEAHHRVVNTDPESRNPGDPDRQWTIIHASELKHLPPLTWLIEKEIPENGLTVLFGESGAGKSFVALDYALRVAQSHPVVYIPTEGEAGYRKRVAAWCQHHRLGEGMLHFLFGAISFLEKELLALLLDDIKPIAPKMIVVDTLAMAMSGGDENSQRDMGIVIKACRTIAHTMYSSVVLVHHVGKAGVSERGSSALRGNADTMIRVNPADDQISIECSKTKDEAPFDTRYMTLLPVYVPDVGDSLVPVPSNKIVHQKGDPLTPTQKKILDYLSLEVNEDGASLRDIADATNVSLNMVQRTLSNLMRYQYVNKPFGSYAITEDGKKAIAGDLGDLKPIYESNGNSPDDLGDLGDLTDSQKADDRSLRSVRSVRSSVNSVDQSIEVRSEVTDFTTEDDGQITLFPKPAVNQYNWRSKGRK